MLGKIKLWAIGILSAGSALLFALLKIRESELDVAEEKIKNHEANQKQSDAKKEADEKVLKDFWDKKEEIEEEHDSKVKQAHKGRSSRLLSSDSLRLLQRGGDKEGASPPSP